MEASRQLSLVLRIVTTVVSLIDSLGAAIR